MLHDIEQRLLLIECHQFFIIVRKIKDNIILMLPISEENAEQVDSMLKQCYDNEIYDVIVVSFKKEKI